MGKVGKGFPQHTDGFSLKPQMFRNSTDFAAMLYKCSLIKAFSRLNREMDIVQNHKCIGTVMISPPILQNSYIYFLIYSFLKKGPKQK